MVKVKKGCETLKVWGTIGSFRFKGKPLGEMTDEELQAYFDADPKNARRFVDGTPSRAPKTDNKPSDPLPTKPAP